MNRRNIFALATGAAAILLGGCASQDIAGYANQQPVLELQKYFDGTLDAYGVFTDRSGTVVKRFTVVMQCSWDGDAGVLDEDFHYSDGTRQKRVWRLKKLGQGRFVGHADDVVGEAVGESRGNAFHWNYTLKLPLGSQPGDASPLQSVGVTAVEVQFDDWMYLVTDKVMLNKATMSKFGVRLGEVTLSFSKR
jgi:hypothetical protein